MGHIPAMLTKGIERDFTNNNGERLSCEDDMVHKGIDYQSSWVKDKNEKHSIGVTTIATSTIKYNYQYVD